jgi:hypothetical protein
MEGVSAVMWQGKPIVKKILTTNTARKDTTPIHQTK